jgi:hypothetical protein
MNLLKQNNYIKFRPYIVILIKKETKLSTNLARRYKHPQRFDQD